MITVQLALSNTNFARSVANLLNGEHHPIMVAQPDLSMPGLIVSEARLLGDLRNLANPERLVIVARKDKEELPRLWDAGIRTVIFDTDTPQTAYLAILALESKLRVKWRERN